MKKPARHGAGTHAHAPIHTPSLHALALAAALVASAPAAFAQGPSPEQRAADLVARMTLEEKAAQLSNDAPAIPRLRVPNRTATAKTCTRPRTTSKTLIYPPSAPPSPRARWNPSCARTTP